MTAENIGRIIVFTPLLIYFVGVLLCGWFIISD